MTGYWTRLAISAVPLALALHATMLIGENVSIIVALAFWTGYVLVIDRLLLRPWRQAAAPEVPA